MIRMDDRPASSSGTPAASFARAQAICAPAACGVRLAFAWLAECA
jgi:hypothetical protein